MTAPKYATVNSYRDCEKYYSMAAEAEHGIRLKLDINAQAVKLRAKLHAYRVLLRKQSKEIYPEADPRHGTCPYDHLVVKLTKTSEGPTYLDIVHQIIEVASVEEILSPLPQG